MDETYRIGQDLGGQTIIHPVALGFTILMGILIFFLPRKYQIVPFMLGGFLVPMLQRIVIASLDFSMLRILLLFAFARLFLRHEMKPLKLNAIDHILILWVLFRIVTYTLLWQTSGAFFNRLGGSFDALGIYFLFRFYIRDVNDIQMIIKTLSFIAILVAVFMINERLTRHNIFSIFGGVPEITYIREGRLRCQGAFFHPILAGSFGAALMPLFISFWLNMKQERTLLFIGGIAATVITVLSSSSGPIISYAAGLAVLSLWPLRKNMNFILWGIGSSLLAIQILMRAPIWALFMHVKVIGASTGFYRYFLIDEFIRHFFEWALLGTKFTASWGRGLFDLTNQYIRIGVDGGLISLVLFLSVIFACYRNIDRTLKRTEIPPLEQILVWGIGVSFLTNLVSFLSVSYFDQIIIIWYMTLAIISLFDSIFSDAESEESVSDEEDRLVFNYTAH